MGNGKAEEQLPPPLLHQLPGGRPYFPWEEDGGSSLAPACHSLVGSGWGGGAYPKGILLCGALHQPHLQHKIELMEGKYVLQHKMELIKGKYLLQHNSSKHAFNSVRYLEFIK